MPTEKTLRFEEMDSAQKKFEAKAAQFREISTKMRRGMVNAMRNGELERLVGEMTEVLETQAQKGMDVFCCLCFFLGWKTSKGLDKLYGRFSMRCVCDFDF